MSTLLAGDRPLLTDTPDHTTIKYDAKGTGRVCGSCTLCCRLVPVVTIDKPANERCRFAKVGKGCTIYARRPYDCQVWTCRWLADPKTAGMPRPDRAHYVIDAHYDYVTVEQDGRAEEKFSVLQVWVDPAHRDAHRAPALRAYLLRMAEEFRCAAIIRWSSTEAMILFPPPLTTDGQWHENTTNIRARTQDEESVLSLARRTELHMDTGEVFGAV